MQDEHQEVCIVDMEDKKFTLWVLAWPIFIEVFLQFLLGTADTLMVSRISDDAVAVVGFSNQLFNALMILFTTIASGAGILIAQKIGSRQQEHARTIGMMALNVGTAIGLLLSLLLIFFPVPIARMLQMPEPLLPLGKIYISIVGGGMVLTAIMSTLSTVIRSTGNTKGPMFTAIGMNVVHIFFNYAFIFGAFGFPQWGLTGVAISTLLSRILGTILLFMMFLNAFERRVNWRDLWSFDSKLFKDVMRIAWPLGVNMASWVFSQLIIFSFISMLGPKEMAARTYMNTLESFCFLLGSSVAMALQIQVAHLFGGKRTDEAYRSAYRALGIGLVLVTVNAFIIYLFGRQFLGIFTTDHEIIALGASLLGLNLILQPGKMMNMAMGNSLNAVGDSRYTMTIAILSMWSIATGLSYALGVHLGWGLIGIYCCMITDEYLRGILVLFRWKGQKKLRYAERPEPVSHTQRMQSEVL